MGYIGDQFTWRRGDIRERFDRAVCNLEWANKFPRAAVMNEEHVHFDHRPVILDKIILMIICFVAQGVEQSSLKLDGYKKRRLWRLYVQRGIKGS